MTEIWSRRGFQGMGVRDAAYSPLHSPRTKKACANRPVHEHLLVRVLKCKFSAHLRCAESKLQVANRVARAESSIVGSQ